jgi:hypothetical protein
MHELSYVRAGDPIELIDNLPIPLDSLFRTGPASIGPAALGRVPAARLCL